MIARPFVIGLTGSIGMGKSTTARLFAEAGLPVWDADAAVARLYSAGGGGADALAPLCPAAALPDGSVDREALKAWIASDPTALKSIERVVHPLVAQDRAAFLHRVEAPAVVLDIPLLFEGGLHREVDLTVVVSTDPETQRRRVLDRPGMTAARFEHLLAQQMPDSEKRRRADIVICSDTLETARAGVQAVLDRMEARHA